MIADLLAKRWDDMALWERLVVTLYRDGPTTTGQLGHIYGIGENVRGIRREADRNLAGTGWEILSRPTYDEEGRRKPWATYELVNEVLQRRLEATAERVRTLRERRCASGNAARPDRERERTLF